MGRKQKEKSKMAGDNKAAKPVAPVYSFMMSGRIVDNTTNTEKILEYKIEKFIKIKLPCTLADLASECANAAFAACEELAFKAGIEFLPEHDLTDKPKITDEDIPF